MIMSLGGWLPQLASHMSVPSMASRDAKPYGYTRACMHLLSGIRVYLLYKGIRRITIWTPDNVLTSRGVKAGFGS